MTDAAQTIVIRQAVEDDEDAHHGGAWKVAYADFMTAMMAFFLLMWILSTAEEKKLEGLADYFTPGISQASGLGGEGALAGTAPDRKGILAARVKEQPTGHNDPVAAPNGTAANPWAEIDVSDPSGAESMAKVPTDRPLYMPGIDAEASFAERQNGLPGEGDGPYDGTNETLLPGDHAGLEAMAERLEKILHETPDLADLAERLDVTLGDAGLEMQILDDANAPMFPLGQSAFTDDVAVLVDQVAQVIAPMPNRIVITGHTDAAPFARQDYSNWELSTDRAHATRRVLIERGVAADRFARVSGMADQELRLPEDPLHPSNRRIAIHLLVDE